ncbi:DUF4230 domain-containing protein [Mediannikoviicoccus vaginalis]|uniref:DUF4230 domain-containing protein n=1 Tax=Mediannikoviicoccus vaginalis TaxID=2899727 RepID=UPI001F487DA3|nr:DUF4230 domain-containing protein [Mediannikoviicoccus vaginalis]
MKTKSKKFLFVKIIVLLVLGCALFFAGMLKTKKEMTPEMTTELINNRLEEAKELTTTKYYYTNMGQFENQNDFYGWKVPFTTKSFIVSYDGIIHAGVNLENAVVDFGNNRIDIQIPSSTILSHEIKEESLKVFLEKDTIFNPIKIEDYNDFSKDQKKVVEEKAIKNGLLTEANEKAEKTIKELLKLDDLFKDYEIKIYFK